MKFLDERGYIMRIGKSILIMVAAIITLTSCQKSMNTAHRTTMEEMLNTLEQSDAINQGIIDQKRAAPPIAVTDSLLPSLDINLPSGTKEPEGSRFDIAVKEVPARQFLMGLVAGTPYSMIVSPKVEGTISLNLKNVTIEEALKAAQDAYGYVYEKTSYGFKVMPAGLQTKVFQMNYLNITRQGQSMTRVTAGSLTEADLEGGDSGSTSNTSSSNGTVANASVGTNSISNFWPELDRTIRAIIGSEDGRSVIISPQSGIVVVRAYPEEIKAVGELLNQTEKNLTRQVILEAKILEVALNDGFQSGINWNYLGAQQHSVNDLEESNTFPLASAAAEGVSGFNGIFGVTMAIDKFSAAVKLLSQQGNVHVLSSPRISTVNNQKAVIKVGNDEFFVTEVSGSTSAGTTATTSSQNIELTPFFSGISLDVTPHISSDGAVILHIHPTISEVSDGRKDITVGGQISNLPLAKSSIRESDNIVRAENGQVVVIGGLMKTTANEQLASTPGLGKMPVVGTLFRRTQQAARKSELIILLRPIVVGENTWRNSIRKSKQRLERVKRGFHLGSKGEVFKPVDEANPFKN